MRMKEPLCYQECDRRLWIRARQIMRDMTATVWQSRRVRRRAFMVLVNMWIRDRFHLSRPPKKGLRLHIHGHHCGPGIGGPDAGPPIDALDHACKCHDDCYGRVRGSTDGDA